MSKLLQHVPMVIGSAVLAVAPKCPFCILAYFGLFGVATTSVSVYRVWLLPLTAIWLTFTVGMLAFPRGGKLRYGPALLGVFAGIAVCAGKFVINDHFVVFGGLAVLVGAVVWRSWILRQESGEACPPCEQLSFLPGEVPAGKRPVESAKYRGN